jgi:Protein of unknown function with PCYCGC motif
MSKRILTSTLLFFVVATMSAQWVSTQDSDGVPAYNRMPPAKGAKLPPILLKEELWGENGQSPFQTHAYELAAKIPSVIHQMPCYCHCDRMGHKSLRSCFEGTHGAQCDICMKELYYTSGEKKKGKTIAQIRKGIIAGEWRSITPEAAAAMN